MPKIRLQELHKFTIRTTNKFAHHPLATSKIIPRISLYLLRRLLPRARKNQAPIISEFQRDIEEMSAKLKQHPKGAPLGKSSAVLVYNWLAEDLEFIKSKGIKTYFQMSPDYVRSLAERVHTEAVILPADILRAAIRTRQLRVKYMVGKNFKEYYNLICDAGDIATEYFVKIVEKN